MMYNLKQRQTVSATKGKGEEDAALKMRLDLAKPGAAFRGLDGGIANIPYSERNDSLSWVKFAGWV